MAICSMSTRDKGQLDIPRDKGQISNEWTQTFINFYRILYQLVLKLHLHSWYFVTWPLFTQIIVTTLGHSYVLSSPRFCKSIFPGLTEKDEPHTPCMTKYQYKALHMTWYPYKALDFQDGLLERVFEIYQLLGKIGL